MGNADRPPELAEDLTATFCRTNPPAAAKVFARATFLSDNRADLANVGVPHADHRLPPGRHRAARSRRIRPRSHSRRPAHHPGRHRPLPARERTRGHRRGPRGIRLRMTDAEDLWQKNAPSGQLAATPDGRIVDANATLASWLGTTPNALHGKLITDLFFTIGGRIHFETHFAPLLQMSGQLDGISVELRAADGSRRSVFLTANVKRGADGRPALLRVDIQDARERRSYERELLDERQRAESERARAQSLAETLRRSLLPPSLSVPEGLAAAAHYHARYKTSAATSTTCSRCRTTYLDSSSATCAARVRQPRRSHR